MNTEDKILYDYAAQHKAEYPGHYTWIGMNFVQCETCGDHAHDSYHGYMIRHNADYSILDHVYPTKEG